MRTAGRVVEASSVRAAIPFAGMGRFLLALPMLVYPVLHFVYADFVTSIVPPWIPWHFFWTYFTALTIMAAGVAILFKKAAHLAAILLGIEILLFVALIHISLLFHGPGNAWAERAAFGDLPSRVINAFKDFGLSGAVFLFAGSQSKAWREAGRDPFWTLGSAIVSISIAAFGILHFVYPAFAPGIPPMLTSISFPLPGHLFWVHLSGAALLAFAVGIWIDEYARTAALLLGATILFFDLLTWGPIFIGHPAELAGNWLKDAGIAGGAWVFYGAYRRKKEPAWGMDRRSILKSGASRASGE